MASSLTVMMSLGPRDVLFRIRSGGSNQRSVVFVVVNDTTGIDAAFKAGANFAPAKPVEDTVLRGFIDLAVGRMEREHRDISATNLACPSDSSAIQASPSREGHERERRRTRVGSFWPVSVQGVVTVQFELPSAEPQTFKAKAEVVWNDAHAMGLTFFFESHGNVVRTSAPGWILWRHNCNSASQPNPAIRLEKNSEPVAAGLGFLLPS